MVNLLFKEFKLSINKFFVFVLPILTSALFLIPQWPYLLALMYFFFITITNVFPNYNAQRDNDFTIVLPIRKRDMVRSRILAMVILELIHIATGIFFAILNHMIYQRENFFLDTNMAFFGMAFIMFALFNLIFFPIHYKTGYKYGLGAIIGILGVILFSSTIEISIHYNYAWRNLLEGHLPMQVQFQFFLLLGGIFIFALFTLFGCKISEKRFENVDL